MKKKLKKEFNYYIKNQGYLVNKYNGKYIVIRGEEVIGSYDSDIEAIKETSKKYPLGSFLVQKCEPGTESYTQHYHSRVAFN
ncbi:MAG: DUF5678 domain-containing protein [bacterium]